MHFRLNGITVGRRCLDDAQVARTHQGELQGTGNGRGGHGQGIHVHFQLAELLLDGDTEFLFFVDNQQAEVFELNVFTQNAVGTDKDIHLTVRKTLDNGLGLCRRPGAAQIFHTAGQAFQALLESLEMLIGKNGGGNEDGHLLVVRHRLESGTHGNLGLAEAYVAAYQPVHGAGAFHIRLYVGGRLALVGGILVNERRFQFPLQETVGAVLKTFLLAPLRIELYQVAGYILNLGLGTVFQFLPCAGTQLVEAGSFAFFAFVLGNLMQRMDGDKDHIVILIDQTHHFLRRISVGNTHQSRKTSHAVVGMHHVISGSKLIQLFQAQSHLAAAGFIAFQVVFVKTVEQLVVGKDAETQSIVGKALVQGTLNGGKGDVISPVFKDSADTVGLFQTVTAYIKGIVARQVVLEAFRHQVEILMEDRLRCGTE